MQDRYYLTPGEGYIREIRKQSGDKVKEGERILLLSEGASTDLQMTVLTLENCYTESENDNYRSKLEKYCVAEGDNTIVSGGIVAILANGSGGDLQELKSRYSGVIKETPLKRSPHETNECEATFLTRLQSMFEFAKNAPTAYQRGNQEQKKVILARLADKYSLLDRKITVSLQEPLRPIKKPQLLKGRFDARSNPQKTAPAKHRDGGILSIL